MEPMSRYQNKDTPKAFQMGKSHQVLQQTKKYDPKLTPMFPSYYKGFFS